MTIDFWGLGLQTLNVLILVWLLSRVFWRPVAAAITTRQEAAQTILDDANMAQGKADALLAELNTARAGIEAERQTALAKAKTDAETATKATIADAQIKADNLIAATKRAIADRAATARKQHAAQAADLSVDIAAKLLSRLSGPVGHDAFLGLLVEAIAKMPQKDSAALVATGTDIDLISAEDLGKADKAKISNALAQALGKMPAVNFVTDPAIIAGLEIRTPHFTLHNSWRSDLTDILKELKHVA
jgi:F-type H+-transporting ATPase subunit b